MALTKDQLSIAEQFVKAMQAIAGYAEKAEVAAKGQAESMKDMSTGMATVDTKQLNTQLSEVSKKIKEIVENMSDMSKGTNGAFKGMSKGSKGASAELVKLTKKAVFAKTAFDGFGSGIKNVSALMKTSMSFVGGFVESIGSIGLAIIAIPFKMFKGLIDIANSASGGANELATAMENLRKEFGAFTGPTSKAVIDLSVNLKGFSDTGLSTWRVFGDLAKRIQDFTKLAVTMGSVFDKVRKEFVNNGGALLAYQKGLGLADEDMKTFAERSVAMGEKMGDSLKDVTKYADSMGRAFGMDSKLISRGMVKAAADVKHFANTTVKELSIAVAYSKKLGVELEKIVSVMDAFETFDSAAENAAKLSQSFGVQVDAFKMMEAQNPAEQIEMLRDQMKAAGQDASTFNRQQLKLLASTTGLDEKTAQMVFSQKNQGKSLKEVQAEAGKTEKKTLTQAEAMGKLADSIERLVMSGGGNQGGFFDRFFKGFLGGIQSSKEFMSIIRNINLSLMKVEMIGVQLGRTFVKTFPGVKDFFDGINDFFKSGSITTMFKGFTDNLKWFFNEVSEGRFSFKELMERLQKNFFSFFTPQTREGSKIVGGFKTIFDTVQGILAAGIVWISDQAAKGITMLSDVIAEFTKDPSKSIASAKGGASSGAAQAAKIFSPLLEAIKHAWDVLKGPLAKLAVSMIKGLVKFLTSDDVKNAVKPAIPFLAAAFFGPVFGKILLTKGIETIGGSFLKMLKGAASGPAAKTGAEAGAKALGGTLEKSLGGLAKYVGPVAVVAAIAAAAVAVGDGMEKYGTQLTKDFGATEAKVGGAAAGIVDALTLGLLPENFVLEIGKAAAGASEAFFGVIDEYFGQNFSDNLKQYIGGSLDVIGSLGGVVKSLFTGDSDKIADAFADLGDKMLTQLGNAIKFVMHAIPSLMAKIPKMLFKVMSSAWAAMGSFMKKGKDIPIIGILFEGMSMLFTTGSKVFKWLGELFSDISDVFENLWSMASKAWSEFIDSVSLDGAAINKKIKKWFSDAWDSITDTFSSAGTWFEENVWDPISSTFSSITDSISNAFSDAWDAIADTFSWDAVTTLFDNVVAGISKALKKLLDIPVFKDLIKVAKKAFKINSPSEVFADIGENVVAGFDKSLATMPGVMTRRMNETSAAAKAASPSMVNQDATRGGGNSDDSMSRKIAATNSRLTIMQKNAAELSSNIGAMSESVIKDGIGPAVKAIDLMVDATQKLDDALVTLTMRPVNIKARLGQVAKSMGLGGSAVYKVESKPITMTVNMHVMMDTTEVERIMITSKSSVIRDRINFIGENVPAAAKEPLFRIKTNTTPATIKGGED